MTTAPAAALPDATKLAVERTRLAHERTLMAWVRTATSLISFGFTIYKFLQYVRENQPPATGGDGLIGPRGFALLMIGTGLCTLILATIEHRRRPASTSPCCETRARRSWPASLDSSASSACFRSCCTSERKP